MDFKDTYTWDIESENWNDVTDVGIYNPHVGLDGIVFHSIPETFEFMIQEGGHYWSHNGGGYDNKFMLEYGIEQDYFFTVRLQNSNLIYLEVLDSNEDTLFYLHDTFPLFPRSLDVLADAFSDRQKMEMDRGNMGKYSREQRREYVLSDCKILYDVLENGFTKLETKPELTIASTTMKQWKQTVTDAELSNLRVSAKYDEFCRNSYYGGRVDVFKRYGENLTHYDVHSMYPFVMRDKPYPYGRSAKTSEYKPGRLGIYKAHVTVPEMHIPPLPYRDKDGRLLFPTGNFTGYYTSAELEYLRSLNGDFTVIDGIYWQHTHKPFDDHIDRWYDVKQNADGGLRFISKLYLNSLYGKLGQRREFEGITMDPPDLDEVSQNPDKYRRLWSNDKHELWGVKETTDKPFSYVHLASFVTSYARIHLHKLMSEAHENGTVYYCDTDCLVTDSTMARDNCLGGLGLECSGEGSINEGYFLRPKLYAYKDNGETEIKAKGFQTDQLSMADYESGLSGDYSGIKSSRERIIGLFESMKRDKDLTDTVEQKRSVQSDFTKRRLRDDFITTNPRRVTK